MPWLATHMYEQITISGKKNPSLLLDLMPAIFTFGATPTIPVPLEAAAMVPAVCVPCPFTSLPGSSGCGSAARAVGAVRRVVVRRQVRVGEVQAGVDVADDDLGAAAGDRVSLGRLDLSHVPLQAGQVVTVGGRRAARQGSLAGVVQRRPDAQAGGGRHALDTAVGPEGGGEVSVRRAGHDDADGTPVGDECAARPGDRSLGISRRRICPVHDDKGLRGRARLRGARRCRDTGERCREQDDGRCPGRATWKTDGRHDLNPFPSGTTLSVEPRRIVPRQVSRAQADRA